MNNTKAKIEMKLTKEYTEKQEAVVTLENRH